MWDAEVLTSNHFMQQFIFFANLQLTLKEQGYVYGGMASMFVYLILEERSTKYRKRVLLHMLMLYIYNVFYIYI